MPDTHVGMLQKFIGLFHRRMLGVEMKPVTIESLGKQLGSIYTKFQRDAKNPRGSVMILTFGIYEVRVRCFDTVFVIVIHRLFWRRYSLKCDSWLPILSYR